MELRRSICALALLLLGSGACYTPSSTWCTFDLICPPGTECDPVHGRCIFPVQRQACEGHENGDRCDYPGVPNGVCDEGVCLTIVCGNALLEPDEVCDDGNNLPGDGCSADCLSDETCGNALVDFAVKEQCDCGDDPTALPEGCRAVNGDPDSQCSLSCLYRYCSNNVLDPGELCDDGNLQSGDGCAADCRSNETCGNGLVDFAVGETCDDGARVSGDGCSAQCRAESCGNGIRDPGEACDDGNYASGDGCRGDCLSDESCGNGITDLAAGELCDCGQDATPLPTGCDAPNGELDSRCSGLCQTRFCGNGTTDPGEVCDDGNVLVGDGCSPDCLSDETCGNGRLDVAAGETCDCGTALASLAQGCTEINGDPAGECTTDCQSRFCGNATLDLLEACDDGNQVSGDGCRADCLSDESCGNGMTDITAGERCDCGDDPQALPPGCDAVNGAAQSHCSLTCQLRFCGNGVTDPGEVCDDANQVSGDGCSGDCLSDEVCGNGQIDFAAGEGCDDGNVTGGDGCSAACQVEVCGNGQVDPGEACDDGNQVSGDGCRADCLSDETCGNGVADLAAGESCDDGNTDPGDGCGETCQIEVCGNGILDPFEACDDGNHLAGDGCGPNCLSDETCGNGVPDLPVGETCDDGNTTDGDGCSGDCQLEQCGNGRTEGGEVCDDGNNISGDGCSANCLSDESCGNGLVDVAAGEACDDGNTAGGDGCSATCLLERCGNGSLEQGEVCDDGNNVSGDGCNATCISDETCGNGIVDVAAGENCDDGNTTPQDGCNGVCLAEFCGNGVAEPGEVCDDGNNLPGDGCSPDCLSDERCGNGVIDFLQGEQCDDGGVAAGDGCGPTCRLEGCGNGVLDPGEECDDGNNANGDQCSANCQSDESCGNGVIDFAVGEQCDDGGVAPGDSCGPTCLWEYCGNRYIDPGELCDDGNVLPGDGCSPDCLSDETCGNGIVDAGEQCDDHNTDACDGCDGNCQLEVACPVGEVCCAGVGCTPEDESNCGACGRACGPSIPCFHGTCIEPGIIVVTEFMAVPDAAGTDGEYIELYNTTNFPINLNGWHMKDDGDNTCIVDTNVWVPALGYAVLARNDNYQANGGVPADWMWCPDGPLYQFHLNSSDVIEFEVDPGTGYIQIDRVAYGGGDTTKGVATQLDPDFYDATANDNMSNWCGTSSANPLPGGDLGTPGQPNEQCP